MRAGALGLALAAVIAGARSYRAIAEWVGDLHKHVLGWFGVGRGAPSLATIRRVVLGVDADLLDALLSAWVAQRASRTTSGEAMVCLAVDGKSARGARSGGGRPVHLVAAVDHTTGVVRGRVAIDATSNEITAFAPPLDRLDLTDVVVTGQVDRVEPGEQVSHGGDLVRLGGHGALVVDGDHPATLDVPGPGERRELTVQRGSVEAGEQLANSGLHRRLAQIEPGQLVSVQVQGPFPDHPTTNLQLTALPSDLSGALPEHPPSPPRPPHCPDASTAS